MKKYLLVLFLSAAFPANGLLAQNSTTEAEPHAENRGAPGLSCGLEVRGAGTSGWTGKRFGNAELELLFGYGFTRRWSVYLPVTETIGLLRRNDVRSYETATSLGLGAGYAPLDGRRVRIELTAKLGTTLGRALGGEWQFVYYDFGVRVGLQRWFYLGVGVRYFDRYKGGFGDRCTPYAALGCTLFRPSK